jgi:hypothetical protein
MSRYDSAAIGTSTRAIRPTARLARGSAITKTWAMRENFVDFSKALAGGSPDKSLWRMHSNTFYFTVYVNPLFAQSAIDAPKADLIQSRQVHHHRPRERAGTDSPVLGLFRLRFVATSFKGRIHNFELVLWVEFKPESGRALWGVTLPTRIGNIEHSTFNAQHPMTEKPGVRYSMLNVFKFIRLPPGATGFYKNRMGSLRPAAGRDTAKKLRKARWVGRKATSHNAPSHRMT